MRFRSRFLSLVVLTLAALVSLPATAQDWVRTGSNLGNAKIRIAAADFKPVGDGSADALAESYVRLDAL